MANIFRKLFHSKKHNSKEDEDVSIQRDIPARRSFGGSTRKSSGRARFLDDGPLSATAAYHTSTSTRRPKAPQSCPGGYREENDPKLNKSFESEFAHTSRKDRRPRDRAERDAQRPHYMGESFHHRRSIRDTSEYGSGDPSPVAHQFQARHNHYESRLDETEDDEFDEPTELMAVENAYRHYANKWKRSEQKRMEDKKKIRDLERDKEEMQRVLFQQIDMITKSKERYKKKAQTLEAQMHEMRMSHNYGAGFNFMLTPHAPPNFPSLSSSTGGPQRLSFMTSSMAPISSTNTPTTSAMDSTCGGAGESLAPHSDLSLIVPMAPLNMPMSTGMSFGGAFDDEADETKNFRCVETPALSIETPRTASNSEDVDEQTSDMAAQSDVTLHEHCYPKDEGYSTTTEDSQRSQKRLFANTVKLRNSSTFSL